MSESLLATSDDALLLFITESLLDSFRDLKAIEVEYQEAKKFQIRNDETLVFSFLIPLEGKFASDAATIFYKARASRGYTSAANTKGKEQLELLIQELEGL